jgi:Tfp pilus assembly protein FimT
MGKWCFLLHRKNAEGFTIIELILVCIIIVILYGMFVPRYTKEAITKHKVYSTAHDLAADLRYARRLSIGGGTSGNSGKVYWLKLAQIGSATDTWYVFEHGGAATPIKTVTVLDGVELELTDHSTNSFYFDTMGVPHPNGAAVEVRDTANIYRWHVSVVRSGRVELIEN